MKLIYDTINKTVLPWPRIDDEPVIGLEPHLLEMTVIQEDEPTYNPETQTLEQTQVIDTDARTVTRGWSVVEVPAPTYTAEDWTARFFSAPQILALQRFEFALAQAAQPLGPNMTALRAWLEQMLLASVDPTPRSDWEEPPCSYAAAAGEAVVGLQAGQNPET